MLRRALHTLFALLALAALPAAAADLTYVFHPPTIRSPHPPLIVLMHGSGADERDMISMWPQLPGQLLVVALREPGRFRGAVVLSGSLLSSGFPKVDRSHEAFFIGHGTADERIPFGAATSARASLDKLGVPVAFHAYAGMRHGTSDAEMKDLSAWLGARLTTP